jgi:magnesium-transporting ATPase (P-type)
MYIFHIFPIHLSVRRSLDYFHSLAIMNSGATSTVWIPFIFSTCFIALARDCQTILNKSGHPCLVPDFRGNGFSFSPFVTMLIWAWCMQLLLCWGTFLLFLMSSELSSWKDVEMLKRLMVWFLSLILFMCCITFIILHMVNHPCIPGVKPKLSWCMIFLVYIEFSL